jgi:hypothetical protein
LQRNGGRNGDPKGICVDVDDDDFDDDDDVDVSCCLLINALLIFVDI